MVSQISTAPECMKKLSNVTYNLTRLQAKAKCAEANPSYGNYTDRVDIMNAKYLKCVNGCFVE